MKILVTGGAGYVGSHCAKVLASSGFEPVVFDNLCAGHDWAVRWGRFIHGDLADRSAIAAALKAHSVQAVIHFAAFAYVGESVKAPREYFRNNVANTLNLLDVILDAGIDKIVFSSTCATYGEPIGLPISEDHPQTPLNPYGDSKLFVERVLRWYQKAYGLRWMALRYFNAAGADPDGEIGEDHNPETHLIPLAILSAAGRYPALEILGTDYHTPDGTAIRDYIHVTDLADAHVRSLFHLLDGGSPTSLNLGTGIGSSIRDVIRTVERVSARPVPVRNAGRRDGDPAILVADPSRARRLLGWNHRYSDLQTIVETAWRWHTDYSRMRSMPAGVSAALRVDNGSADCRR
jgi:UDP-arabinose 4-epimerase